MKLLSIFKRKREPQRLHQRQLTDAIDKFTSLDETGAQKYLQELYDQVGEENIIRLQDALTRRSVDHAMTAAGGNMELFVRKSLSADENDGSELGRLMSRSEMLMRFLMGKSANLLDSLSERGMDRLSERAADQLDISVEAAKSTLMGFIDIIARRIPDEDAQLLLNNLSGSRSLAERMISQGHIDGSMEKAVQLIQKSGISVKNAIEVRDILFAELDRSSNIHGLTSRIKNNLGGMLPPFF